MPPPDDSGSYPRGSGFYSLLTDAINDFAEHGFDSQERLEFWVARLREAAIQTMTPPHILNRTLQDLMRSIYRMQIERGGILKYHAGINQFTLQKVAPRLRQELDRRIMASAGLIKLNRDQAIETTLRRFAGWATSIPAGGSDAVDRMETKGEIRKALASLPFTERRVAIDQGHKFTANLNNILATDGGAIALIWHSYWRQRGYRFRPDHKERDGQVYLLRDNWAQQAGLVKVGDAGYYDSVTSCGEEVFCRCYAQYLYSPRAIERAAPDMLTAKGRADLERVKVAA
jgi:hypothetical protein